MVGFLVLLFSIGLTIGIPAGKTGSSKQTPTLSQTIRTARHPKQKVRFHPPSRLHFSIFQKEIAALAKAAPTCNDHQRSISNQMLNTIGMEAVSMRTGGSIFWVVREKYPVFRGSGIYICRCHQASRLIIQAPHSYHDIHTGRIARVLFREAKARWLFLNTFQRYRASAHPEDPNAFHPADCAHNPHLFFQAATLGLMQSSDANDVLFVQIHGFDASERTPGAVLTDGHSRSSKWSSLLKSAWKIHSSKIRIYSKDTREFGGTSNVQAVAVNNRSGRFIQIEMDLDMRKLLRNHAQSIRKLAKALVKTSGSKTRYRNIKKD